jgi:hypothetical protein
MVNCLFKKRQKCSLFKRDKDITHRVWRSSKAPHCKIHGKIHAGGAKAQKTISKTFTGKRFRQNAPVC